MMIDELRCFWNGQFASGLGLVVAMIDLLEFRRQTH